MAQHLPAKTLYGPVTLKFNKTEPFHLTRNPVTHSGRGFRAKFCSQKNGRMIRCESLLELNFLFLAEFARNVVTFEEQPVTVQYRLEGRQRRYTPDFVLHWADGRRWYVEVKPWERLCTEENKAKFRAIADHFKVHGDHFLAISEREIMKSVRQGHVRTLLRLREKSPTSNSSHPVWGDSPQPATFGELSRGLDQADAMTLLAQREFVFNLNEDLTAHTAVCCFTEADDAALFI